METKLKKLQKELEEVRAKKEALSKKEKKICEDMQKIEAMEMKKILSEYDLTIPQLEEFLKKRSEVENDNFSYGQNNPVTSAGQ